MRIGDIIMYGSIASPVIPLTVGVVRRKALDRTSSFIFYLVLLSFVIDMVSAWTAAVAHRNNLPIAHFYGLLEGMLLIAFFNRLLDWRKTTLTIILSAYVVLYCLNSLFIESIYVFNAWSRSAESILMMALSVLSFHHFYTREEDIFIEKSPQFWFVIAIFTYFSGALFSFLLATDMLSQSSKLFYGSWVLHNTCNLLKNVIFAIGLWKLRS